MFDFLKKKKKNTNGETEQTTPVTQVDVPLVEQAKEAEIVPPLQEQQAPAVPLEQEPAKVEVEGAVEEEHVTQQDDKPEEEVRNPDIIVRVSKDSLTAYLKVKTYSDSQRVTLAQVLETLENMGIKFGINKEEIKAYCAGAEYYKEAVIAQGTEPEPGVDGSLEYMFETEHKINLVENEVGIVNFRELNAIKSVRAGDVLCKVNPPTSGKDGSSVYGVSIMAKSGKSADLKYAENTKLSDNGLELTATIDGCIDYNTTNGTIGVSELYNVRGDVSSAVGNLDCLGSIIINGDVREGFIVKAKKDILIKGVIEGATIIAGGTITISNGMNGMGIGKITAGGDIISKYFENTEITSTNGSVLSDVIINSNVNAGKCVILKGGKGSLIGGTCTVGRMVYAAAIGARTNVPTSVIIESKEFREALIPDQKNAMKKETFHAELSNLETDKAATEGKLAELTAAKSEAAPIVSAINDLTAAVAKINADIEGVNKKLAELSTEDSALGEFKVIATKTCFSGVKISMAYLSMHCDDDYAATKFFVSDHQIKAGQILPSDKLN